MTYSRPGSTQTTTTTGTTFRLPPGGLDVLTTYTITVKSQRGSWSSVASNTRTIVVTSVVLVGVVASCGS